MRVEKKAPKEKEKTGKQENGSGGGLGKKGRRLERGGKLKVSLNEKRG